jgi:hypothetical protein
MSVQSPRITQEDFPINQIAFLLRLSPIYIGTSVRTNLAHLIVRFRVHQIKFYFKKSK